MRYFIKPIDLYKPTSECLIVPVFMDNILSTLAKQVDKLSHGYIQKLSKRGDIKGELGQILLIYDLPNLPEKILLIGCGRATELNAQTYRKLLTKAFTALKANNIKAAVCGLMDLDIKKHTIHWKIRQAVELVEDIFYSFDQFKSKKPSSQPVLNTLTFQVINTKQGEVALKEALAITAGMKLTKDLGNLPANICTPSYIAKQAQQLNKIYKPLKVNVLEQKDMERLGMGALLAVARGSQEPAKLVVLEYQGAGKTKPPVALVGKGVTFDSGGICIKPAPGMEEMKFDMCGAASVLGTFKAIAELKLKVNLVGIVPLTENLPSGTATKPGDVVETMSGQTVEIINTDAEGRLILCDALTYSKKYKPAAVIDIATLTGAIIISLGSQASGLFSNSESLTKALQKAADESGDRVWAMPLWEEYQEQIDSNIADMANIGTGGGKSITAACFLARFTQEMNWAHLDIAGTAWRSGQNKSATGRPVPLLVQYLLDYVAKE